LALGIEREEMAAKGVVTPKAAAGAPKGVSLAANAGAPKAPAAAPHGADKPSPGFGGGFTVNPRPDEAAAAKPDGADAAAEKATPELMANGLDDAGGAATPQTVAAAFGAPASGVVAPKTAAGGAPKVKPAPPPVMLVMLAPKGPLAGWLAEVGGPGVKEKLGTEVPPGELPNVVAGANVKDVSPQGAAGAAGAAT
jgi:hypothetical protein